MTYKSEAPLSSTCSYDVGWCNSGNSMQDTELSSMAGPLSPVSALIRPLCAPASGWDQGTSHEYRCKLGGSGLYSHLSVSFLPSCTHIFKKDNVWFWSICVLFRYMISYALFHSPYQYIQRSATFNIHCWLDWICNHHDNKALGRRQDNETEEIWKI